MTISNRWMTAPQAWSRFVEQHPELGYPTDKCTFHNFLRHFKKELVASDVIRLAKRRHWIADSQRFPAVAFDCASGRAAPVATGSNAPAPIPASVPAPTPAECPAAGTEREPPPCQSSSGCGTCRATVAQPSL